MIGVTNPEDGLLWVFLRIQISQSAPVQTNKRSYSLNLVPLIIRVIEASCQRCHVLNSFQELGHFNFFSRFMVFSVSVIGSKELKGERSACTSVFLQQTSQFISAALS
jgi:hypothetical protein